MNPDDDVIPMHAVTWCSDPARLSLSISKFKKMCPECFGLMASLKPVGESKFDRFAWIDRIALHMDRGDSRAAVVLRTNPLLVSAYTDEFDCVTILGFGQNSPLVDQYQLVPGYRLLSVNRYFPFDGPNDQRIQSDLIPGPRSYDRGHGVYPIIADFLTNDIQRLQTVKHQLKEAEWQDAYQMGMTVIQQHASRQRNGNPLLSCNPSRY